MSQPLPLPLIANGMRIRGWADSDANSRFDLFRDPEIVKYVGGPPSDLEQSTARMRKDIEATAKNEAYMLALSFEGGPAIGFINIQTMKPGDPRSELVIGIASKYRKCKYGAAAARVLVSAAFDMNLELVAIYGRREWGNKGSRGIMRALNMRSSGLEPSTKLGSNCPDRLYVLDRAGFHMAG
jgi:hypothetical protein